METRRGKLIVIEGVDGSGKQTQFTLIIDWLKSRGVGAATFDFPQYDKPSGYFVDQYLRKKAYGPLNSVSPKKASLFYAMDRFDVSPRIVQELESGKVVLMNRYVASNLGHQGSKMDDSNERLEFYKWVYELEHDILEIPKPDINVVLHIPAEISYRRALKRCGGDAIKLDLHENPEHLKRAEATYLELARIFPNDFKIVECVEDGRELTPEEVQMKVRGVLAQFFS